MNEQWSFTRLVKQIYGDWTPPGLPVRNYGELKGNLILSTLEGLQKRIDKGFPGAGLGSVCRELSQVSKETVLLVQRLHKPIWQLRILTFLAIAAIIAVAVGLILMSMQLSPGVDGLADLLQAAESAINELIFLGLAIYFFGTLEGRFKRTAALRSLHRLRSMAHVVDMHQLTKDPAYLLSNQETHEEPDFPSRKMTAAELTRYLDFCSELLAILSKLAALHLQYLSDSAILNNVTELESLTHGLSNKIWQKIMILDFSAPPVQENQLEKPAT